MRAAWAVVFATALAGASMTSIAQGDEDEKVVSIDQIPAPARASLVREAKGDAIVRVEVENHKGGAVYEGVVKHGDDMIGITVNADGKVLGRHSEKHEHK